MPRPRRATCDARRLPSCTNRFLEAPQCPRCPISSQDDRPPLWYALTAVHNMSASKLSQRRNFVARAPLRSIPRSVPGRFLTWQQPHPRSDEPAPRRCGRSWRLGPSRAQPSTTGSASRASTTPRPRRCAPCWCAHPSSARASSPCTSRPPRAMVNSFWNTRQVYSSLQSLSSLPPSLLTSHLPHSHTVRCVPNALGRPKWPPLHRHRPPPDAERAQLRPPGRGGLPAAACGRCMRVA